MTGKKQAQLEHAKSYLVNDEEKELNFDVKIVISVEGKQKDDIEEHMHTFRSPLKDTLQQESERAKID